MWSEFFAIFLPCFAALWLICSIITFVATFQEDDYGDRLPFIVIGFATIFGPIWLGLTLADFSTAKPQGAYRDSQSHP